MEPRKSSNGSNSLKTGLVQNFRVNSHREVEHALKDMECLGISRLRTRISWAEWHSKGGRKWYDWLFAALGDKVEVLPCVYQTPPPLAASLKYSAPPRYPEEFANFTDMLIRDYGAYFSCIELWNEPNNPDHYDFTLDHDWNIFCEMTALAAKNAKRHGKATVLGGMNPVDPNWLQLMYRKGLMDYFDIVGVHIFPDRLEYHDDPGSIIEKIRSITRRYEQQVEVWITETGYPTWKYQERRQLQTFLEMATAEAGRIYWLGLSDPPAFYFDSSCSDERLDSFGIKHPNGSPKLLYSLLMNRGDRQPEEFSWMAKTVSGKKQAGYILITGGAGFVGTNLAANLMDEGNPVMILDNLSRGGVLENLNWLRDQYPDNLQVMIADIRDRQAVAEAVGGAEQIYHLAAQVAVTSSLNDPFHDFDVNALGTLTLLEAVRHSAHRPPVLYTSTNKVYGDLNDLGIIMNGSRYHPDHMLSRKSGISEQRNLEFHSPYGCSKGVAEQYVLDYARTFGLRTIVFRMSCIYGPHQFGTEDQGWVAHFLIQALKNERITIFGDGRQVRDILFIDDLVNAFRLAMHHADNISGNAYNIGGGPGNTVSLLELISMAGEISGKMPDMQFDEWRTGDQKYYVSDFSKFHQATGWAPVYKPQKGIQLLYDWLQENAIHEYKDSRKSKFRQTKMMSIE